MLNRKQSVVRPQSSIINRPRIFITGMGGMLGQVLATLAISENYFVGGTIRKSIPSELELTSSKLLKNYRVDLRNKDETKRAIVDFAPDILVHLAAKTLGRLDKNTNNFNIYDENVTLFKNVLAAVKSLQNYPRFILGTSGCIVYNRLTTSDFISERSIENLPNINPRKEPYRAGRLEQERLLASDNSLDFVITRATQFTGPGKFPGTVEYFIAQQISEILQKKRDVINVKYALGEVDMLDVRDVASAYLILIRKGESKKAYHISSGHPVTVASLAEVFLEIVGLSPKEYPIISENKEPVYFRFSPAKLKKLDWQPQYTLKDILQSYWTYFKKRLSY